METNDEAIWADRHRRVEERIDALLLEGLNSGIPIEPTPGYWEVKKLKLAESIPTPEARKLGLSREGFLKRLRAGKSVNCVYRRDEFAGLISAWAYEGRFILTCEECPAGEQYDESCYTRDERHEFATADEVLAFVEDRGYPHSAFQP